MGDLGQRYNAIYQRRMRRRRSRRPGLQYNGGGGWTPASNSVRPMCQNLYGSASVQSEVTTRWKISIFFLCKSRVTTFQITILFQKLHFWLPHVSLVRQQHFIFCLNPQCLLRRRYCAHAHRRNNRKQPRWSLKWVNKQNASVRLI